MANILLWLGKLTRAALYLFIALIVFYAVARFYVVYTDSQVEGVRTPYLQMQSSDGVTVMWNTAQAEIGVVRYGKSANGLDQIAKDKHPQRVHEIRIKDLEPATRYFYSVGGMRSVQYGDDQKYWFVTAPAADSRDPVRLWVIGDSGQPGEIANAVRDSMKIWVNDHPRENRTAIDQWILLGDNAYRSGSNQQYQVALFDTYPSILRNFAFWPAYGNHDARRWTFFDIFSLPEKAEAGGRKSGTEHYYSFNYGNIHIIMLDSQDSGREPGDRMLRWLEKDLNEAEQQWKIVVFHHPPYSKGSHDSDDKGDSGGRMMEMRSNVLPILEKYDVDLVLSGHSHGYERSRMIACHYGPSSEFSEANVVSSGLDQQHQRYLKASKAGNGTLYVVAGASSKVDYAEMNHPAMAVSKKEAGSLLIDIEGNVLTGRYINAKAAVIDEFSIEKQADYTSGFAGCV